VLKRLTSSPALRAFRHRNFRLFFVGQGTSMLGTWIQQIAQSWLVYRLTGSPFLLGLTAFSSQFPILVLAPLAGLLSDRFDRKRLLVITQSLLMLQALALATLALSGLVQVWHILALALFYGAVMGFDTPVRQSLLVELVHDRADLPNAIALNSMLMNSSRLVGPSIAGLLLAIVSEGTCFLINALSYVAIIAAALALHVPRRAAPAVQASLGQGLAEGVLYAWSSVPIRMLLPMVALVSFTASPYVTLMPVVAKEVLGGGAHTLGFLVGAAGLGALGGTSWLATRRTVRGLGRVIASAAGTAGLGLTLVSFSHALWVSLPLMVCVGFGIIVTAASTNTILQTIVEDDKRGRVMSFYTMSFLGVAPLGALAAGALASRVGAPYTLLAGGICCLAGAVVFQHLLPRFGREIRPLYQRLGIATE
jgi:MFS family permease